MNKRILTRILSFVLVLCLLVPMIPYAAIMSDAASSSADSLRRDHRTTAIRAAVAGAVGFLSCDILVILK